VRFHFNLQARLIFIVLCSCVGVFSLKTNAIAFGRGDRGQLANGKTTYANPEPTPITNEIIVSNITAVAGGDELCSFFVSNGTVFYAGQVGLNFSLVPAPLIMGNYTPFIIAVAGGGSVHALLLSIENQVLSFCITEEHASCTPAIVFGRISSNYFLPAPLTDASGRLFDDTIDIIKISAGEYHSLLLSADGDVYSFGVNKFGQLGTGDGQDAQFPKRLFIQQTIISVSAGATHSVLLSQNGTVYTFGNNEQGQLGGMLCNY
jgi:alpha-tubulin suppressor-like RCC1 family protein